MDELKQFQILFNLQKQLIGYFSKHLSLLLLIPALLGGIWQIIELSHLSFSYIRFFSPSQVLADGLLILLFLVTFLGTFYALISAHKHYITADTIDNNNSDITVEILLKTSFVRCISLFSIYLLLLFLELYILSKFLEKPDSFFTILLMFLVVVILLYLSLIAWMYSNLSIINTWLYQKIVRHTIWFWITAIVFSFLLSVSSFRNAFTFPKNLINTDIIVNRIAKVNPGSQPNIVYNNDKYLFIELNDFFFIHGKPANGAMLIVPVEDIFNLAESNYKLPEHTKAAFHYHLKEKQKEVKKRTKDKD